MLKKLFLFTALMLVAVTLTACKAKVYTVTFDSQGGTEIAAVEVEEGNTVATPDEPTKADAADGSSYSFVGWYTDAAGSTAYNFDDPVEADVTVFAVWSLEVVLRFDTRTDAEIAPQLLGETGGNATAPADPTRDGFRFGGWFTTKRGLTWLETEAIEFPLAVDSTTTIYAYWEPVDSKAITWGPEVTYTTSIDSESRLILNPMVYEWSHEDAYINMLSTDLYVTEVDWDKAIEDGVADAPGDFSKIIAKEYSIEALDFGWILEGATNFPIDSDGDEHLTEDGKYDRDNAATFKDTVWTFKIRDDLQFEDGTPITAATYEYTLKMFLDPVLNNYRANLYYKSEDNQNGDPILNAYEYYLGDADWEDVGFTIVDDYTFTIEFFEARSQADAVGFGSMPLVHPAAFEASLTTDRTNSTYGTPANPYVSYGPYVLKSWDENQKLVFNKNYDYVLKGTVNYKCQVVEVVANVDERMQLFEDGTLSVTGLSQDYFEEYAEHPNLYKSWRGYPQYLIVNLAPTKVTEGGNVQHDIMFDVRFRQALLYGFDRKYYATSVYAPNTAALLPVPLDTKSYNQDALYYSESPQHLAVLDALNINPETEGYIPDRAISLFNAAYDAWIAEGNTGPVVIGLSTDDDEFSLNLTDYIEAHYEDLFGADKIDIVQDIKEQTAHRQDLANWNFDLSLNSIGFGSSVGVWWQYQAIAFFGDYIGGGSLGLSQPWDASTESGIADYASEIIEIDLTNTYNYLVELGTTAMEEDELEGHLQLFEWLDATEYAPYITCEVDGVADDTIAEEDCGTNANEVAVFETAVAKEQGHFYGTVEDIGILLVYYDTPFDGSSSEPFTGATTDTWNVVAAFEKVFFDHVPQIPTVTRSDAIVYAENVVIEWPAYSSAFGWGANRYRYLNTDPDFME